MRIAIFHDYFGCIGGGEKLVLTLAKALHADVITTDIDKDAIKKMGFGNVRIISIGSNPQLPPLKQVSASLLFSLCDFSKQYDFFVFSGNWAHYAAAKHNPNLWYCHTPVRAFYDLRDYYLQRQPTPLHYAAMLAWQAMHGSADTRSLSHVQRIVANSRNTQQRIKRFYGRDAVVVYPPVPTKQFRYKRNGDFWLSVNRLYPEKRVDLQIEAFRRLPSEKLLIVGGYSKGDHAERSLTYLKKLPKNVNVLGTVPEKRLRGLYATCKAFVTTAMDEDFGLTVVEAMAAGKPVVATREGGHLETMIDGKTGVLVDASVGSVVNAIERISQNPKKYRKACEKRAKYFDERVFVEKMRMAVESAAEKRS
jgi:glycosyltransferase involved in cell wall biosynthesis